MKGRPGHECQFTWVVVSIIQWAAVPRDLADSAYSRISQTVARDASQTERGAMQNPTKTCACQGSEGASYTFGCSWNMYLGGLCKYGKSSGRARKFKLNKKGSSPGPEEIQLEEICSQLTDCVTSVFQRVAPACFDNMTVFSDVAKECRIGSSSTGQPFSGVTVVSDFCAHQHKDINNMTGGSTVVLTLTKPENRDNQKVDDEQLHVLPQYEPDATCEELLLKQETGGLETLKKFERTIVIREAEGKKCNRGKPSMEKKKLLDGTLPKNYSPSPEKLPRKDTPKKKLIPLDLGDFSKFESPKVKMEKSSDIIHENNNAPLDLTFSPPQFSSVQPSLPVVEYPQFQLPTSFYYYPSQAQPPPPPYLPYSFYPPPHHHHQQQQNQQQYYQLPGSAPSYPVPGYPQQQPQNLNLETMFSPEMLSLLDSPAPSLPQLDGNTEVVNEGEKTPVDVKKEALQFESEVKAEVMSEKRYETDCREAIQDPEVGGLALALPHGSVLVEVAKAELHATTALKSPSKMNPCRVGLVFYQHGSLHLPQHGKAQTKRKDQEREFRDYVHWLAGWSVLREKTKFL